MPVPFYNGSMYYEPIWCTHEHGPPGGGPAGLLNQYASGQQPCALASAAGSRPATAYGSFGPDGTHPHAFPPTTPGPANISTSNRTHTKPDERGRAMARSHRAPPRRYGRVDGPIGPPEYRNMHVRFDRPPGGRMENGMQYEYSSMTGRRKALLIGINYKGTKAELKGCWNDVANIRNFILHAGFRAGDMVVLTDETSNPRARPTRAIITAAMHWLVKDSRPGDSLFFHYSGHGAQAKATQGDEADGLNECIVPLDYMRKGLMEDDELHAILVRPLPVGCRLTALFDSCHSGTVLDLPYVYATSGQIKEVDVAADFAQGVEKALKDAAKAQGGLREAAKDIMAAVVQAKQTKSAQEVTMETRSSGADVVMFSGCKDSQTSADTYEAHRATGALSFAWITVFAKWPHMTYLQLLNAIRDELVEHYTQKPQLSSSHPLDLNVLFTI